MAQYNTLQEYLLSLKLSPFYEYSEESTRAMFINYLVQKSLSKESFGNIAISCLQQPERLIVDLLGKPLYGSCIEEHEKPYPLILDKRWALASAISLIFAFLLLYISIYIINKK